MSQSVGICNVYKSTELMTDAHKSPSCGCGPVFVDEVRQESHNDREEREPNDPQNHHQFQGNPMMICSLSKLTAQRRRRRLNKVCPRAVEPYLLTNIVPTRRATANGSQGNWVLHKLYSKFLIFSWRLDFPVSDAVRPLSKYQCQSSRRIRYKYKHDRSKQL